MCGRYALGVRLVYIRNRLQQHGIQVDDSPDDEEIRETYNFAPGNYGVVYRADAGHDDRHDDANESENAQEETREEDRAGNEADKEDGDKRIKYKLQKMKWGLIPFWTKRQPDYGSMMRTINCRDDSLIENRGMWTTMKKRKRCVVVCQGFYEWLKKGPGGKEKIPHFVKRKDGDLMWFAGLWDCVTYEGSDEKLYTYTIITTSSNSYLKFLHDRMPVILEPGSDAWKTWLDPQRTEWSEKLQSILKPYEGELECYPVPKEVGKVGNNSPDFILPINSKEKKGNIANFFASAGKKGKADESTEKLESKGIHAKADLRETKDDEWSEDNAPKPVPKEEGVDQQKATSPRGIKRERSPEETAEHETEATASKAVKMETITSPSSPEKKEKPLSVSSPIKSELKSPGRKTRSATKNDTPVKSRGKKKASGDGSQPITIFFKK
ncbi:hypothetical protein VTN77DRAFT_3934 [Rasamsonia byssochlamydoides]|uniref:uncharacterized protein n=1 Tax=Rasamsonia byssochlamydoides TaxID=89139 RepID=UPI003742C840